MRIQLSRATSALTTAIVLLFVTASAAVAGTASGFEPDRVVDASTSGYQYANAATGPDGTTFVAYPPSNASAPVRLLPAFGAVNPATETVSPDVSSSPAKVVVDSTGTAAALRLVSGAMRAFTRRADGTWQDRGSIATGSTYADVHRMADGRLVAAWTDSTALHLAIRGVNPSDPWIASVAPGTPSGSSYNNPSVAADADGNVVACWSTSVLNPIGTSSAYSACSMRRANGTWDAAPTTIGSASGTPSGPGSFVGSPITYGPWIAVSSTGRFVVVHGENVPVTSTMPGGSTPLPNLHVTSRRAADASFTTLPDVATQVPLGGLSQPVQHDAAGNVVVVWETSDAATPTIDSATLADTATTFGATTVVGPGDANTPNPYDAVSAASLADGAVAVAWAGATTYALRVAVRAPGAGAFASPVVEATGTGIANRGDLSWATDDLGNAVLLRGDRIDDGASNWRLVAATLDRTAPALTAVTVPESSTQGIASTLAATAADRLDGAPTVTWSFGDGAIATGAAVTHAWGSVGRYTVTVTATDGAGNTVSATRSVLVAVAAVPPAAKPKAPVLGKAGKLAIKLVRKAYQVTTGLVVTCPAGGPACTVTATLTTPAPKVTKHRPGAKVARPVVLGTLKLTIKPGAKGVLVVRLTKAGTKLLATKGRLKSTLALQYAAGATKVTTSKALTLVKPKVVKSTHRRV